MFFDLLVRDQLGTGDPAARRPRGERARDHAAPAAHRRQRRPAGRGTPHPRAWGTFPRYLGHYGRELGLLALEECVGHLTGRAAARLRLTDRGLVRAGYAADLVLFDPDTVADTATFDEPAPAGGGHPYVFVNGELRHRRRPPHRTTAGRALRRTPTRKHSPMTAMSTIAADRALTVVRAPSIPDPAALANALAAGGIRAVELTFTTPEVLDHLRGGVRI